MWPTNTPSTTSMLAARAGLLDVDDSLMRFGSLARLAGMPALPRATAFPLAPGAAERLEALLAAEFERVRVACADEGLDAPVCALALIYVHEHDLALAENLYALTEPARARTFDHRREQGLWDLWSPAGWDHTNLLGPVNEVRLRDGERVAASLIAAGCTDPQGAFVRELAHRLARHDWAGVMTTTVDFACWAVEHEVTEDVFETFRVTAPPRAVEAYEQRGWLRFPAEFSWKP
jgi:hypothetical protein